jgi:dTDP-4-amino-4,6-dideoxygalactose transaminase
MGDPRAQYQSLKAELDSAALSVLESGQFILGNEVTALEAEIASLCGCDRGVGVANGTDALVIALRALDIGPGDEVITTPFTFFATAEAISMVGATPVFADIDPRTFNLDPRSAASRVTSQTAAILPVHLYGQPADMTALCALAERCGVALVEDNAQAIGARWDGRATGSFGAAAGLSFYPTKNLGSCGDAGMMVCHANDIAEKARMLRFHGSGGSYKYGMLGYNSRLDEIQAALLRVKLSRLQDWNERRRYHADRYTQALKGNYCVTPPGVSPQAYHVFHHYTLRTPDRARLRAHLESRGIQSGVYYPSPLHLQPVFAHLGYRPGDLPESERASAEVLSLPVYPELPPSALDHVCQALAEYTA